MVSDYFAVLRQPRRPWIDPEQLKQAYQQLTFDRHPDRIEGAEPGPEFAEITEAYRVLSNPKLRLQHLLGLEGIKSESSKIPAEIAELFMNTASLVSQIDQVLQRRDAATTALSKSMLRPEILALQQRASDALNDLNQLYAESLENLQRLNEPWVNDSGQTASELDNFAQRFGYLDKWIGQLREKQFQLANE